MAVHGAPDVGGRPAGLSNLHHQQQSQTKTSEQESAVQQQQQQKQQHQALSKHESPMHQQQEEQQLGQPENALKPTRRRRGGEQRQLRKRLVKEVQRKLWKAAEANSMRTELLRRLFTDVALEVDERARGLLLQSDATAAGGAVAAQPTSSLRASSSSSEEEAALAVGRERRTTAGVTASPGGGSSSDDAATWAGRGSTTPTSVSSQPDSWPGATAASAVGAASDAGGNGAAAAGRRGQEEWQWPLWMWWKRQSELGDAGLGVVGGARTAMDGAAMAGECSSGVPYTAADVDRHTPSIHRWSSLARANREMEELAGTIGSSSREQRKEGSCGASSSSSSSGSSSSSLGLEVKETNRYVLEVGRSAYAGAQELVEEEEDGQLQWQEGALQQQQQQQQNDKQEQVLQLLLHGERQVCFYEVLAVHYCSCPDDAAELLPLFARLWSSEFTSQIFVLLLHQWLYTSPDAHTEEILRYTRAFLNGANAIFWVDLHSNQRRFQPLFDFLLQDVLLTRQRFAKVLPLFQADMLRLMARFLFLYHSGEQAVRALQDEGLQDVMLTNPTNMFIAELTHQLQRIRVEDVLVLFLHATAKLKGLELGLTTSVRLQVVLHSLTSSGAPLCPTRPVRHAARHALDSLFPIGKRFRYTISLMFRVLYPIFWPPSLLPSALTLTRSAFSYFQAFFDSLVETFFVFCMAAWSVMSGSGTISSGSGGRGRGRGSRHGEREREGLAFSRSRSRGKVTADACAEYQLRQRLLQQQPTDWESGLRKADEEEDDVYRRRRAA